MLRLGGAVGKTFMIPYNAFHFKTLCAAIKSPDPMSLTLEQVKRIAHLARIEISDDEAQTTQGHLNGIFQLIEEMQAVDTRGVEPMAHAQDVSQRLREDAVTEGDRRAAYQAVAPDTEAGLYLVPKVIE
ncbi:MAG: aspartyl-tRNA(Asn)/glutamyl-tRNA (Gln) amidotransferase subunit C [Rhodocyclaceae bacterium]|nr:MAG: aspartyl-tRNA(Asn)/glutamyl-tRNA (Gln) amidotransferase subunit C [Rhodocyclaceae bacterium]